MRFSDEDKERGHLPGVPSDAPVTDFGRRRVAGILKRERPRHEQDRESHWNAYYLVERMFQKHPYASTARWWWLGKGGASFEVYCMWRRATVSAGAGGIRWRVCYDLKKAGSANLNLKSRYLR